MTDPVSTDGPRPAPRSGTRPAPRRAKPTAAAKAGRLVAAGGAVGASLAMVGAMAGAAASGSEAAEQPPQPTVIRRVVVPQPVAEPMTVVVPQQATAASVDPVGTPAAVPALSLIHI